MNATPKTYTLTLNAEELRSLVKASMVHEHTLLRAKMKQTDADVEVFRKLSNLLDQYYDDNGIED